MSFFDKIQENVIETAEQMIKVVEEGVAILTGGTPMNDETKEEDTTIYDEETDVIVEDEEDFSDVKSPLDSITEGVLSDLMKNQATPASARESFDAFRSAITWNEPFILTLVAFQIVMLFCTFMVTRRYGMSLRLALLSFMFGIVRSAEWLNKYGARTWEKYATQNYFDEKGIFVSLMLSAPILLMAFFMLISFLREASSLLVEVKRHEIQQKKKSAAGKSNGDTRRAKKSSKKND